MSIKAAADYPSTTKYVPDQYKTKGKCIRVVNTSSCVFNSVAERFKTQEMCDKAVEDNPNA